jgi:two-component system response regulator RegX3
MTCAAGQACHPGEVAGRDAHRASGRVWRGEVHVDTISGKVLLVSSDAEAGQFWADALRRCGAEIVVAWSAPEALDAWEQGSFDLILIDANAHVDGVGLCRHLRSRAVNPILLLGPGSDEARLLEGYRAGADECVPKPVDHTVLLAKVKAWLRHRWMVRAEALDPVEGGGMRLEPQHRQVVLASGAAVGLSNLELRVLYVLMTHRGRVLSPDVITMGAWGHDGGGETQAVRHAVHRLRRKIEPDPRHPRTLQTVAGKGYTFRD